MIRSTLLLVAIAIAIGLSACNPPQSDHTADGRACTNVGYSWRPVWVDPQTRTSGTMVLC
jgi:hypothetical protein